MIPDLIASLINTVARRIRYGSNDERDRPRYLMVDVSVILRDDAKTGIQRVVRAVWLHLNEMRMENITIVPVYATKSRGYHYARQDFLTNDIDRENRTGTKVSPRTGDIFLGLDLAAHILPRHDFQMLIWKARGVSIHLVVYDLLPVTGPQWFRSRTQRNFRAWLRFLVKRADGAICISNAVADELRGWLRTNAPRHADKVRISGIRLGYDIDATGPSIGLPHDASAIISAMQTMPTILMVGTVEPRKAYDKAIAAFEQLWRNHPDDAPNLLIVGKPGWKTGALQEQMRGHPEAGRRFLWLPAVSDEFLQHLYEASHGIFSTSHAEGYGLPIVEAAAHKRPVLARDLPVFHEIKHPAIAYFEDDTPLALSERIREYFSPPPDLSDSRDTDHLPRWADTTHELVASLGLVRSE